MFSIFINLGLLCHTINLNRVNIASACVSLNIVIVNRSVSFTTVGTINLIISDTDINVSCTIGNLANNAHVVPLTRGIASVHRF